MFGECHPRGVGGALSMLLLHCHFGQITSTVPHVYYMLQLCYDDAMMPVRPLA